MPITAAPVFECDSETDIAETRIAMSRQKNLPIAAIVLAAGAGERYRKMSGEFKLLARLSDGRRIIRATCELAADIASPVIVVGRCELLGVKHALVDLPVTLLACPAASMGPGDSLRTGLAAVPAGHAIMVFLADMPYISHATATAIRLALLHGADLVRPVYDGIPGHPVGFAPDFRNELLTLDCRQGAAPLLRKYKDRLQRLPVHDAGCVHDIDKPGDIRHSRPSLCAQ